MPDIEAELLGQRRVGSEELLEHRGWWWREWL
jgi:hypothetical protein